VGIEHTLARVVDFQIIEFIFFKIHFRTIYDKSVTDYIGERFFIVKWLQEQEKER
jgi:hypothetical protein